MINTQSLTPSTPSQILTFTPQLTLPTTPSNSLTSSPSPFNTQFCIQKNQAYLICIDRNCSQLQPFICLSPSCQCSKVHKLCDQKRIQALNEIISRKQAHRKEREQLISQVFESLIDKVSEFCDKLMMKLKTQKEDLLNNNQKQNQSLEQNHVLKQNHMNKNITGSLIHKLYNSSRVQNQLKEHEKIKQKIKRIADKFQKNQLKTFLSSIQTLATDYSYNSPTLSPSSIHKNLQAINPTNIICKYSSKSLQLAIIQPSFSQISRNAQLHKFKLKAVEMQGDFRIGYGNKKYFERQKFMVDLNKYEHNYKFVMVPLNQFQLPSKVQYRNVDFARKDIISIEFNPTTQKMILIHQRTKAFMQINCSRHIEDQGNEYCLAIGMNHQGDQVEIVRSEEQTEENRQQEKEQKQKSSEYNQEWDPLPQIPEIINRKHRKREKRSNYQKEEDYCWF